MASVWQKTLFYLGLVDEDQGGTSDAAAVPSGQGEVRTLETPPSNSSVSAVRAPGGVEGRRVEPPAGQRVRMSPEPSHAEAGVYIQRGGAGYEPRYVGYGRSDAETEIIIARNGLILNASIVEHSGDRELDRSVSLALGQVHQLDPLPAPISASTYKVILNFDL